MSENWLWLSDWASDFNIWSDELSEASSDAVHTFVSYEEIIKKNAAIYESITGLKNADTVVASGFGALVLLLSAEQRPKNQKWILLSPFVDFCDEAGEWSCLSVQGLARQIKKAPKPSLESFLDLMGPCDEEVQEQWLSTALKMDLDLLSKGLEFLTQNKLTNVLNEEAPTSIYYGRENQFIPPALVKKCLEYIPFAVFKERPKSGHWVQTLIL